MVELLHGIGYGVFVDGMPLADVDPEGFNNANCQAAGDIIYDYDIMGFNCENARAMVMMNCEGFEPIMNAQDDLEMAEEWMANNVNLAKTSTESNSQWGYYAVGGAALVGGLWYLAGKNAKKTGNEEFLLQ